MWCYNILGDNEGIISDILPLDPIASGCVLLADDLVVLKRVNNEPILTVKRTELSKFNDYFGLRIQTVPSRVVKKRIYFPHWVYTKLFVYKAP